MGKGMTKFRLESVDILGHDESRVILCENYTPTVAPSYGPVLEVVGNPHWARRRLTISSKAFTRQKALWDIDGVIVRNGEGHVLKPGEML